jgi:hypothetical protein
MWGSFYWFNLLWYRLRNRLRNNHGRVHVAFLKMLLLRRGFAFRPAIGARFYRYGLNPLWLPLLLSLQHSNKLW